MSDFLHAVKSGDAAAVDRYLDEDAANVRRSENGVSPVLLALYHGQRDIARLLIRRGAPLSFHDACAAGENDRARLLLEENPALLDTRSEDGYPPLGLAIFFGNRELAAFLIESGADPNMAAANAQRVAPIHAAAAVCDHQTLALLLERGADPNARQQSDFTALHTAASRGDTAMAELLLRHGADPSASTTDGLSVADIARKYGKEDFALWFQSRP